MTDSTEIAFALEAQRAHLDTLTDTAAGNRVDYLLSQAILALLPETPASFARVVG